MKSSTQTYSDLPKSQGFLQIFILLATVHVRLCRRQSSGSNERAKAFCKSSSSWPVCIFDSAQSSPKLPTKKICLTKTCQIKRQAMHSEVAECFHAGGSLCSDGAGTTQAGSIHQRIWICCFAHLLNLTCCKTERRSEESRGEKKREEKKREEKGGNIGLETSLTLTSGSVLKWLLEWTLSLRCCRRNAACVAKAYGIKKQMCPFSTLKISMSKPKRERDRQSVLARFSRRTSILYEYFGCSLTSVTVGKWISYENLFKRSARKFTHYSHFLSCKNCALNRAVLVFPSVRAKIVL